MIRVNEPTHSLYGEDLIIQNCASLKKEYGDTLYCEQCDFDESLASFKKSLELSRSQGVNDCVIIIFVLTPFIFTAVRPFAILLVVPA